MPGRDRIRYDTALRLYLVSGAGRTTGWLFALSDPKVGRAARAIHAAPAERWTLLRLSAVAGLSRSKFAERFKALTGTSPIDYLTRWRMMLACQHLTSGRASVGQIAVMIGYESEAAFSIAFKRVTGYTPRCYGKDLVGAAGGAEVRDGSRSAAGSGALRVNP